ncbi:MAG: hypothetical protein Kow0032_15040 [Methyloligellaceae bacterium]
MYGLLAAGLGLLAAILVLIWLKDKWRSPRLARLVHSGLVARLALAGVAFLVLGVLLMLAELISG